MIELQTLSKRYVGETGPIIALDNASLSVKKGEIVGVIGRSGAGKSTLIRCVNCLERPDKGSIKLAGMDLLKLSPPELRQARQQMGMIFQHFNLLSQLTVFDNIALPLRLSGLSNTEISKRVDELLELVELEDRKGVFPAQLSGGQKQRVAIARALANNPKVLLCDEATSALDPQTTRAILQLLKEINRQLGLTILLITHEMDVVKKICDRACVMAEGRIVEQNDTLNLFLKPQTELAKSLVHSALKDELPQAIQSRLQPTRADDLFPLLRLTFVDSVTSAPIVSQLSKALKADVNILQAHIDHIQHHSMGTMLIELLAQNVETLTAALDHFAQQQVQVEVLGYVKRDATSHS